MLVFSHTSSLGGWSRYELLAVMGIHILTGGFIRTLIQPNMEELMGNIQEGTLDFALTKPIDAQILISVRQFRLWQLVDVVLGFAVLLFAAYQMQLTRRVANYLFCYRLVMWWRDGLHLLAAAHYRCILGSADRQHD